MASVLNELLGKRRDRAIAVILGVKERECDRYLPPDAQSKLRKVVLDQLNELTDLCLDVVRSTEGGEVTFNTYFLERLDAVYDAVVNGHASGTAV